MNLKILFKNCPKTFKNKKHKKHTFISESTPRIHILKRTTKTPFPYLATNFGYFLKSSILPRDWWGYDLSILLIFWDFEEVVFNSKILYLEIKIFKIDKNSDLSKSNLVTFSQKSAKI